MKYFTVLRPYGIRGVYKGDKFYPHDNKNTRPISGVKRYSILPVKESNFPNPSELLDSTEWNFNVFKGSDYV